ncbi:MAG: UvrD-helicase domain-containing protein, partial [Methylocella sp.]
ALAEIVRYARAEDVDGLLSALLKERATLACLNAGAGIGQEVQDLRQHFSLPAEKPVFEANEPRYRQVVEAMRTGTATDRKRAGLLAEILEAGIGDCEAFRRFFLTTKDEPVQRLATNDVTAGHPWLQEFLAAEQERVLRALGLSADFDCVAATAALLILAGAIIDAFQREKRRRGVYDFDDLILATQRLLTVRPEAAWVLYKLDGGIDHVLLDEAQDMSPAQWEIVRALTVEFFSGEGARPKLERTLFAVGDRKQSIFSFQGANPDTFQAMHEYFETRIRAAGLKFSGVDFTISYRSTSVVLHAVDRVFAESAPARQGLDGALPRLLHHEPKRGEGGTVEIWPLVEPEGNGDDQPWHVPVDQEPANSPRRRLARKIAATVSSWVGSRMLLSKNRPVEPRD